MPRVQAAARVREAPVREQAAQAPGRVQERAAQALERALGEAGVKFRLVIERDDKLNPKLHHREYLAAKSPRTWRLLAATVHEHGQAMLTAAPPTSLTTG